MEIKDRAHRINKIVEFIKNHPEHSNVDVYLLLRDASVNEIREARRVIDRRTNPEQIKVWCEFGVHDTITFEETRVTEDFDEMRSEFLEAIEDHLLEQDVDFYEVDDELVDHREVRVTCCDDSGEIIGYGWIKEA